MWSLTIVNKRAIIASRVQAASTYCPLRPPSPLVSAVCTSSSCLSLSGTPQYTEYSMSRSKVRNSVVRGPSPQRYFYNHEAVCEWQLAVGRHAESMWVRGVITVRLCLPRLPDTTAQRGIDIREKFNKSLVRFTDMLLTPDYFCTFYKNSYG